MTIDQFNDALEILFDCFHVPNKDGKARRYYKFFQTEDISTVATAFNRIAREDERFPTPARASEVIRQVRASQRLNNEVRLPCSWCGGDGRVQAIDKKGIVFAYRCQCFNAARFQNYPAWFGENNTDKRLLKTSDQDVINRPHIYKKGLEDSAIKGMPAAVKEKIIRLIESGEEKQPF